MSGPERTLRPRLISRRVVTERRWKAAGRRRCAFTPDRRLLIVDEVGYLPLPAEAAAALFQVVSQRYLKGSIALTTNLGIASWGKVFNDDPMIASAMLDRLLHRSVVLNIDGDSYRMRSHGPGLRPRAGGGPVMDDRSDLRRVTMASRWSARCANNGSGPSVAAGSARTRAGACLPATPRREPNEPRCPCGPSQAADHRL